MSKIVIFIFVACMAFAIAIGVITIFNESNKLDNSRKHYEITHNICNQKCGYYKVIACVDLSTKEDNPNYVDLLVVCDGEEKKTYFEKR